MTRAMVARRMGALVGAGLVFSVLLIFVGPYLRPYSAPWTSLEPNSIFPTALSATAWSLRLVILIFVALLLARLWRSAGARAGSAGRRFAAISTDCVFLGAMLFALLLPGRLDWADVLLLIAVGIVAVIFSSKVLARGMSNLQRKWFQWGLVFLAVAAALVFVALIFYTGFLFYSRDLTSLSIPIGVIVSLAVSLVACGSLAMLQPKENREQRLEASRDEVDDVLRPMGTGNDAVRQEVNSPGQLP